MRSGFTLIELSIVLVIIGLVVGGVIVGSDMIRSSEIRSAQSDVEKIRSAVNLFRTKVGGLPGDTRKASTYISGATNGNGNGKIDPSTTDNGEEFHAWIHLASSGLLEGSYDGTKDSVLQSGLNNGYYRLSYQSPVYGKSGHMISLNAFNPTFGIAHLAILSPDEVYSMDLKADDGLADSGGIMGFNEQAVPGCVTDYHTAASGEYVLPSTDIKCKVFFRM